MKKNIIIILLLTLIIILSCLLIWESPTNKFQTVNNTTLPELKNDTPTKTTSNIVEESSLKIILPDSYTVEKKTSENWSAFFANYEIINKSKQDEQPSIFAIRFYNQKSIENFNKNNNNCIDTEQRIDNPCSNGGYPELTHYLAMKKGLANNDNTFNNSELKKFNNQNFYYSKEKCEGDSCNLYKYITYQEDTRVEIILISWLNDGEKEADNLFKQIETIISK